MIKSLLLYFIALISVSATELAPIFLEDLRSVHSLEKHHDNRVFKLMVDTSQELTKDWSEELVEELARVYSIVLKKNKNYFIVDLFNPIRSEEKFKTSFKKYLTEEEFEHFLISIEKRTFEKNNGNG